MEIWGKSQPSETVPEPGCGVGLWWVGGGPSRGSGLCLQAAGGLRYAAGTASYWSTSHHSAAMQVFVVAKGVPI